jgi:hypothetical protein
MAVVSFAGQVAVGPVGLGEVAEQADDAGGDFLRRGR